MSQSLIEMGPAAFPLSYISVDVCYFFLKNVWPNSLKMIYLKDSFYKQQQCAPLYIIYAKKLTWKYRHIWNETIWSFTLNNNNIIASLLEKQVADLQQKCL